MKEVRKTSTEFNVTERRVSGYALNFSTNSNDLGGFIETIAPGALDGVLEKSDILCLLNHNEDRGCLARCKNGKGSLTLTVDKKGLKYEFEAPNTALGNELLESLKRGDITSSSFAFYVGDEKWEKLTDGRYLRTITKFKELFDVSPVYRPAYDSTSVGIDSRGLKKLQEEEKIQKDDLQTYFSNLNNRI